jgi:hypothetical protein
LPEPIPGRSADADDAGQLGTQVTKSNRAHEPADIGDHVAHGREGIR